MMTCPNPDCRREISAREAYCPHCGTVLPKTQAAVGNTNVIDRDEDDLTFHPIGTASLDSNMRLRLRLPEFRVHFDFDAEDASEVTLGRKDPDTNTLPRVDLTPYDGANKGVSRKHAVIMRKVNGRLYVRDERSNNGTFLNGQRLVPSQERVLRAGDELRLGSLVIQVDYLRLPVQPVPNK